jgi:hypothetical protein
VALEIDSIVAPGGRDSLTILSEDMAASSEFWKVVKPADKMGSFAISGRRLTATTSMDSSHSGAI